MEQKDKMNPQMPETKPQINHIDKVDEAPQDKESEMQKEIDREKNSEALKDMHLESGEKINEYKV